MNAISHNAESGKAIPCGVETALHLAMSLGWAVFPLNPANGLPYSNSDVAAALGIPEPPGSGGGFHLARSDKTSVRAMWAKWPDAQVGIATGAVSGIYVLDLDRKNGKDGFAAMAANGFDPGVTFWTETRHGRHYFYAIPREGAQRFKSDAGGLGSGIDRKGDGGYIRWCGDAFGCSGNVLMVAPPAWMLHGAANDPGTGNRHELGTLPTVAHEHVEAALFAHDPDQLGYEEWRDLTAAYRGAGGGREAWDRWCAQYERNSAADNEKLWRSFERGTSLGWDYLATKAPTVAALAAFGGVPAVVPAAANDPAGWLVHIDNLTASPPRFIVEGLVEQDALACIFGDPAAGKSLVAMDMAACVATGHPYHGHPVRPGTVVYIAGEGKHGLRRRFRAWEDLTGKSLAGAPLHISRSAAQFLDASSAAMVTAAIEAAARDAGPPKLIVIDTLARNFGAGDENSQKDMTAFVAALDKMRDRFPGCTVIVVHHSGHGEKDRARGSSVLRGAVDAEYKVERKGDAINLTNHKMKDAPPPRAKAFNLVQAAGSVALEHTGEPGRTGEPSPNQRIALEAFRTTQVDGLVSRDDWRAAFYMAHTGENEETKRKAFKRAIDNLCENRFVITDDNGQSFKRPPVPGAPSRP